MNFDGGTVRYNIEVDTNDFDRSFDSLNDNFDRLTKKFEELEDVLDETTQKKFYDLIKRAEDLGDAFESSDKSAEQINYTLKEGNEIIEEMSKLLGEVGDSAERATEPMESLGQALAKTVGRAGFSALKGLATGATTALVGLARKGIQATNFLETSQTAMSGLLGSMEAGTKAMGVAADFWSNNPFNRFDVTSATKQLVQYGRQVSVLADDLKILGDISLSTGVGIDELAVKYGRVASSNRATTEDIEMMANRGVPIYRELAKVLNTTQAGVREFASQGKIDFETFKRAMEGAVDPEAMEKYEQTLDRAKDKLSGSITTLAGALAGYKIENSQVVIANEGLYRSWINLLRAIAGNSKEGTGLRNPKLLEGLTKIGDAVAQLVDKVSEHIEPLFQTLGKIVEFIGDNPTTLIPIITLALNTITGLVSKVPILGNVFGGLGKNISGVWSIVQKLIKGNPLLLAGITALSVAVFDLFQHDEEFKKSISELFGSLMEIVKNLTPVVQTLVQAFLSLAQSGVVQGGLKLIVGLVAQLAKLLASVPTEVLAGIAAVIIGVKLSSINPWLVWVTAIGLIIKLLKELAPDFYEAAHNAIIGFVNGIVEGARLAVNAVIDLGNRVVGAIKNVLGIHSPSTVLYGVGQNAGLGLANGITDSSSIVQKAMNNLASDVLKQAEKVIGNMSSFGLIDANGTYKEWKKVANLFTIGSEQYQQAIEKMEEARKQVNLEIIKLQNDYNNKLDESIKKIQNFYGLFEEVSTKGGKNSQQLIKNLDKQVAQTAEWAEAQRIISGLNLADGLKEELQEMGVSSVSELSSIANMTTSELEQLNTLWLKKQELATTNATEQLADYKEDVLKQVAELSDGIDGETVSLREEGGRLVASIGEGITGALPTLAGSLAQLNDYIAEAARSMSGGATTGGGGGEDPAESLADIFDPTKIEEAIKDKLKNINWGTIIPVMLAGLVGGSLLKNALGGIGGGLGNLLKGKLGSLFGGKSQKLDVGSSVDLSGLNKSTAQIGETSKSLSKANEWLKTIAKGALAIAAIAVAIAAIAGAIWVMDNALAGIDWGTFISKIGMVSVATLAMGAFAYAVGELGAKNMALGAGVIVLLALDIAAIGAAIGIANYAMDGIGWGEFMSNIGMLAVAIVAMGALSAIAGIPVVAGLVALGAVVIAALAADIILVSTSIAYMDAMIPNDLDRVRAKIGLLCEAIGAFELLTGVAGVFALVEGLGILVVKGIADEIAQVAAAIGLMALAIPNDLEMVQAKINLVRDTIALMGESNFGWAIGNLIQSARIAALKPTIDEFVNIGESLKRLEGINVSQDDVFGIMGALRAVVGSGDTLVAFASLGQQAAQSVAQGVQQGYQYIYQAGNSIQTALWQGVQDKFPDEYQQGIYLAYSLRDGIYSVVGQFQRVGADIQSQFWWGVQNKMGDEYNQGRAMGNTLRQGMYDVDYANAGWWAVQGFINGANNRAYGYEGVYHTGWWVADTFLRGLKDRGGQGSPWKTTIESGIFAGEGLVEGLKQMESEVVNEAEVLADGIVNALDMSDVSVSPEMSVRGKIAPSMYEYGEGYGNGIVINNEVTAYTEYDLEQNLADLSYLLSQV